jgi:transporter family-2 protein
MQKKNMKRSLSASGGRLLQNTIILGVAGALVTGLLIGMQSTISNRSGQLVGSIRTGLLMNMLGGGFALLVFIAIYATRVVRWESFPRLAWTLLGVAGILGIFIIIGIAYSLHYTGVVAGLGTVILGQMLISTVVDSLGLIGLERIPFTWQRAAGLLLMAVAVYLLLPRH